jgi:hypothetical protein
VYSFTGPERFTVSFLRQFQHLDEDGEHDGYEQLRCEFLYEATPDLRDFGRSSFWCFPLEGDALSGWTDEVEGRTEFRYAADLTPTAAGVSQDRA